LANTRKKAADTARRRRIRKQVYELTATDFKRHPVWEYALDDI
jgi:hypothetical protein